MKFLGKGVTSQNVGSDEVPQDLVLGLISPVSVYSIDWGQWLQNPGIFSN